MTRVLMLAPGRGAYGPAELHQLPRYDRFPALAAARDRILPAADRRRRESGKMTVSELDSMSAFTPEIHLPGENASALIYTLTAIEAAAIRGAEIEIAAVIGNSLGWYTALHVAGALDFESGLRLVETMGGLSGSGEAGGQIVYPLTAKDWRPTPGRRATVDEAIREANRRGGFAAWSVDLGGYGVLAGDARGLELLLELLPKVVSSGRSYPLALPYHSAFHTTLVAGRAETARDALADLPVTPPDLPLVDGRGVQHRPLTAVPEEILEYTLGEQVTTPYLLCRSIRVGLREYAPDAVLLLGPGESIGGAVAAALCAEGYRGIGSREDFDRVQAGPDPVLIATGRKGVLDSLFR